ncbi:MAG: Crp/Fnr family transcriptional regulator [Balneolaceae bacterium]|nr:Crp/Fnr family transcriptional regulator [Balneolaceae bacterium]
MPNHTENIQTVFKQRFPSLHAAGSGDILLKESTVTEVEKGAVILNKNQVIRHIPLLLEGTIKVLRIDDKGNELYLYHIHPGESCAVTLKAFLARETSLIKAIAVEKSRLMLVPDAIVRKIYRTDSAFLNFILNTYQNRFEELIMLIDQVAFHRVDERLLTLLRERSEALEQKVLQMTHQQLADELNTSREVVSRLLKQMEKRGMVSLGRNKIEIKRAL